MASSSFLSQLLNFPKDTINDEIVELLQPYFKLEDYSMEVAKRVCNDVSGLLCWTKAMTSFYSVNKEVLPLKVNLAFQEARLNKANKDLKKTERALAKKERDLKKVQKMYHNAILEKQQIAKQADSCRKKMSAASTLINGLGGERIRWTQQSKSFKEQLQKLIGDTVLACAFLSYSGPFNQEFRVRLMTMWKGILREKSIPFNLNLGVISMLVDAEEVAEWSLQGLPSDELSLQNAAIVTKAINYPLLVDPQGQGKIWLRTKEQHNEMLVTNLRHKYFRTHLEDSLSLGRPLLIADVGETLDPILDNLLERNFIKQGKALKVMLGDREMDITEGFYLYITTKLPNPAYSPEISARCAIIDFTVTRQGLEDQLLGRVIKMEKADLERERVMLAEAVMENKATMIELEDNLLQKLSSVKGSIVDDDELIKVRNSSSINMMTIIMMTMVMTMMMMIMTIRITMITMMMMTMVMTIRMTMMTILIMIMTMTMIMTKTMTMTMIMTMTTTMMLMTLTMATVIMKMTVMTMMLILVVTMTMLELSPRCCTTPRPPPWRWGRS